MLILISGLPGSGKSYFAKALCKTLNAKHLNSDVIRQQLNLTGQYDKETKKLVYDEMLLQTKQSLAEASDVVVDSTFYKKAIRNLFIELAIHNNTPFVIIEVRAEETTIKKRLQKKREYSEADFEVYQKIKKSFEPIQEDHLVLWSDKITLEKMIDEALLFIQSHKHHNKPHQAKPRDH